MVAARSRRTRTFFVLLIALPLAFLIYVVFESCRPVTVIRIEIPKGFRGVAKGVPGNAPRDVWVVNMDGTFIVADTTVLFDWHGYEAKWDSGGDVPESPSRPGVIGVFHRESGGGQWAGKGMDHSIGIDTKVELFVGDSVSAVKNGFQVAHP